MGIEVTMTPFEIGLGISLFIAVLLIGACESSSSAELIWRQEHPDE